MNTPQDTFSDKSIIYEVTWTLTDSSMHNSSMKYFKKMVLSVLVIVFIALSFQAFRFINTARQIPDAYAAWDAGTLLVAYIWL